MVRSDDDDLKLQWAQACRQGELLLIEVLINHLEKVIKETRGILRDVSGQTYKEFKKANTTNAKENMEEALKRATLKRANAERKLQTKNQQKRKLEADSDNSDAACRTQAASIASQLHSQQSSTPAPTVAVSSIISTSRLLAILDSAGPSSSRLKSHSKITISKLKVAINLYT